MPGKFNAVASIRFATTQVVTIPIGSQAGGRELDRNPFDRQNASPQAADSIAWTAICRHQVINETEAGV